MANDDGAGQQPDSTKDRGDALEAYVASLYRALGAAVEHDVMLAGNQVDLLVSTNQPGLGPFRAMVEVKYRSSAQVPKSEVLAFFNVARALLDLGLVERALIVSNGNLTKPGRELISTDPRMEATTVGDLESTIFSAETTALRAIKAYEANPLSRHFIDLMAEPFHSDGAPSSDPDGTPVTDLLLHALDHPEDSTILFADFGSGKSTTLGHLYYLQCRRYLERPSTEPIPVMFTLKDFAASLDIDSYVLATLQKQLAITAPLELFWSALEQGRFLILLDGFDEISLKAGPEERAEYLRRISPLLFGRSPAVLSSRPSYFLTRHEYQTSLHQLTGAGIGVTRDQELRRISQRLAGEHAPAELRRAKEAAFSAYSLRPLDEERVLGYLESFGPDFDAAGVTTNEVIAFINRVYDLRDLVSRPIILQMLVSMVIARDVDVTGNTLTLGPADLYELYTDAALRKDWQKGPSRREVLTPALRADFAEMAARAMFDADALVLEPEDVEAIVASILRRVEEVEPAHAMTDLRTCSFLTIDDAHGTRFIHKSFQEFFFARALRRQISGGDLSLLHAELAPEVLYFLGSFGISDEYFAQRILELAQVGTGRRMPSPGIRGGVPEDREGERGLRSNAAAAACAMKGTARGLDLVMVDVPPVSRRSLAFRSSRWETASWSRLDVRDLLLERMQLLACAIHAPDLDTLTITHTEGRLELAGAAERVVVRDAVLQFPIFAEVRSVEVEDSTVDLGNTSSVGENIASLAATRSQVRFGGAGHLDLVASASTVDLSHRRAGSTTRVEGTDSTIRLRPSNAARLSGRLQACCLIASEAPAARTVQQAPSGFQIEMQGGIALLDATVDIQPLIVDGVILGGAARQAPRVGLSFNETTEPPAGLLEAGVKTDDYCVYDGGGSGVLITGSGPSFHLVRESFQAALQGIVRAGSFDLMASFLTSTGLSADDIGKIAGTVASVDLGTSAEEQATPERGGQESPSSDQT